MLNTPKTLNVTECHRLLDALMIKQGTKKQFRKGLRNYTMALLMLDAGLRVGEVVQLHVSDLWFNLGPVNSIIVRPEIAKNKTERIIPVSTRLSNALKEMHQYDWSYLHELGTWCAFHAGRPLHPLTTRQVERIIRAAAMKSIGRPVHPHMLRHTFGSKVMRVTNARVVMDLLGHRHITTTQIYCHPNQQDLTTAIQTLENENIPSNPNKQNLSGSSDIPNRPDAAGTDGDVG